MSECKVLIDKVTQITLLLEKAGLDSKLAIFSISEILGGTRLNEYVISTTVEL